MSTLEAEILSVTPLGGGQEVGRSCILVEFKGRVLLLDCGIHPGREGEDSLPFIDNHDPTTVDLILITHFHLDHCASLPYYTERTNFNGRIFMTHATKAVMKLLLSDNVKLQSNPLYSEDELYACIDKIEVVDYHQMIEHHGIRFTASAAGHVLGAAMFTIEIDDVKILYTGDYSMEKDRHLSEAEIPPGRPPDLLIIESTFGIQTLPPREERELRFTNAVHSIVKRGGGCLIPVFALGRAQELLLILDEYWQQYPELQNIPLFYASKMATKALRVYQTFVNMMNQHIRDLTDISNPFKFNYIRNMQSGDFTESGPCVVMASPGFLQSGVSRNIFEKWCDSEKNGLIIAGYTVEGTLIHELLHNPPDTIRCLDGKMKSRKCQIEYISFSAHVDYTQNLAFIRSIKPDNIILVHGEKKTMRRLKEELDKEIYKSWSTKHKPLVKTPANGQAVRISFTKSIVADIVGNIADDLFKAIENNTELSLPENTLIINENFNIQAVNTEEVKKYTSCRLGKLTQRLLVPVPAGMNIYNTNKKQNYENGLILHAVTPYIQEVFDVVTLFKENYWIINVCNLVMVTETSNGSIISVEWPASPQGDTIADSVVGIISQFLSVPSILRKLGGNVSSLKKGHKHELESTVDGSVNTSAESQDETDDVVKKMKLGLLDPMKSLYSIYADVDASVKLKDEIRLDNLRITLQTDERFSQVLLNNDKTKLIVRGKSAEKEEAFCFIRWDARPNGSEHHAVVNSVNPEFQSTVIHAIRNLYQ